MNLQQKGGNELEELRQIAAQIPDSYSDFVNYVMICARDFPDRYDDIVEYLKSHIDSNTSDILGWFWAEFEGFDPDNPVPLEIVDDDEYDD